MNLAFPALFVFLLVLPGILSRYAYLRGSWGANSPYVVSSITDEVAYGLFFAAALHLVWASLISLIILPFGLQIDLDATLMLLLGVFGKDSARFDASVQSATHYPHQIAGYFIGLLFFSGALGSAAHRLVRRRKLDLRYPWLRFRNDWHYLISGEILEFDAHQTLRPWHAELKQLVKDIVTPLPPQPARHIDGVYLSSVVKQGNDSYLYRGIVAAYFFDRAGSLDRVLLNLAHRRRLSDDRQPGQPHDPHNATQGEVYYDIIGDYFVLRLSEMQTINIEYFVLPHANPAPAVQPVSAPGPSVTPVVATPTASSPAVASAPRVQPQIGRPQQNLPVAPLRAKRSRIARVIGGSLLMAAGLISWRSSAGRKK